MDTATDTLLGHFINGKEIVGKASVHLDVVSPIDGSRLGAIPVAQREDVDRAVLAAQESFAAWGKQPVKSRVQVLFRFKQLLERDMDSLSELIEKEGGKTVAEARAEIEKGIEVIEFACSTPQILHQEVLEVSRGVNCQTKRFPMGVTAGITPFNFPAMVPLWMIPITLAVGNSFILKPSEQVPFAANRLAALLQEAGLPDGVFQVIHGDKSTVNYLLEHKGIEAIAFVGSTAVARHVYHTGIQAGKKVLALGGAKNHLIVAPDADPELTASNVVASFTGCAGQRCMAASVLVMVGESSHILEKIVSHAKSVRAGENMGAIINKKSKERIENYINQAEKQGASLLVDGRNASVSANPEGLYVNPTIIDGLGPEAPAACDEIFGPVLTVLHTETLDDALAIENNNPYGNAASIYTTSGGVAQYFADRASAGMVGVNIGVPVPREPFAFGGWNQSKFGEGDITGEDGIRFWTKAKKITTKWSASAATNWMS